MRTLYLTYTGLLEPLGASQVIPHLRGLAAAGWEIDAVSWEKSERLADRAQLETVAGELRRSGVSWRPLRYHKSPTAPATAYDLSRGLAHLARRARPRRWGLVHVRSYVPVPLAMLVKRWLGARFVFDMRGFWADEYADCGIWGKESSLFRTVKDWEGAFLRAADQVVVLTHEARRVLEEGHPRLPRPWRREAPPIQVIPTCANLDLFRPDGPTHPRGEALRKNHFVVGYVGSVGTWYEFDAMFDLINAARREDPSIHFVVVTQTPEHEVRGLADARGLPAAALTVAAAGHTEVASWIRSFHLGLFFYSPAFSKKGTCPTKMGEILGCGVPVMVNRGVGDAEELAERNEVGCATPDVGLDSTVETFSRVRNLIDRDPALGGRCRRVAETHFDVADAIRDYDAIYRSLERERA